MAKTITIGDFNSQKENFTVIDVREPDTKRWTESGQVFES